VLLYGSDTCSVTEASRQRLDAFDQWCLRRILRFPYTAHVTRFGHKPTNPGFLTTTVQRRLKLFEQLGRCSLQPQRTTHVRYEQSPITSLLIGAAQEADLVSPGFEQSRAISNRSTLDFTLHYGDSASNGSSFLATHGGNGYALRACRQMVMMMYKLSPIITIPHTYKL